MTEFTGKQKKELHYYGHFAESCPLRVEVGSSGFSHGCHPKYPVTEKNPVDMKWMIVYPSELGILFECTEHNSFIPLVTIQSTLGKRIGYLELQEGIDSYKKHRKEVHHD